MRGRTNKLDELAAFMRAAENGDDFTTVMDVLCPDEASASRAEAEIARRFGSEPWVSRVRVRVVPPTLRGSPYSMIEIETWREG